MRKKGLLVGQKKISQIKEIPVLLHSSQHNKTVEFKIGKRQFALEFKRIFVI